MPQVELLFPVIGEQIPVDHGYLLYGGLCDVLPSLHDARDVAVSPITGTAAGRGQKQLGSRSRLTFRLPSEQIANVLPLAGKSIRIANGRIRCGVPQIRTIVPAGSLYARLVTIKGFTEPEEFLTAARRQLDELDISADTSLPLVRTGPHAGKPRRRILRIKQQKIVGFALAVSGLTHPSSLRLQQHGLGGRRKMGCGYFVPVPDRSGQR